MIYLYQLYKVIMFIFLTYLFTSLFLSFRTRKKTRREVEVAEEFFCYFLVPCVNEEKVIGETLKKLVALPIKKKIIAIDDGSTDQTKAMMDSIAGPIQVLSRQFPNAQQGKGAALNHAFQIVLTDAEKGHYSWDQVLVGVVDADGFFSENIVNELTAVFTDKTVCAAQTRIKMKDVTNFMFIAQDVEFFTINNFIQKARRATKTIGLGGNGQFFRLSMITEHLGYQPWGNALLDDYELTIKLMLKELSIAYIDEAFMAQEALRDVKRFIRQRSRWVQGNLDCLAYLPSVIKSKSLTLRQKCGIYYFLAQPFINLVAGMLVFVLTGLQLQHLYRLGFSLSLVISFVLAVSISLVFGIFFTINYYRELKNFQLKVPAKLGLIILPFTISYMYLILFVSVVMAYYRFIKGNSTWIKTERN